jgi:hypothetical protein
MSRTLSYIMQTLALMTLDIKATKHLNIHTTPDKVCLGHPYSFFAFHFYTICSASLSRLSSPRVLAILAIPCYDRFSLIYMSSHFFSSSFFSLFLSCPPHIRLTICISLLFSHCSYSAFSAHVSVPYSHACILY